jgi:hypothetical protein
MERRVALKFCLSMLIFLQRYKTCKEFCQVCTWLQMYFLNPTPFKTRVLDFNWVNKLIKLIFFLNQNDIILVKKKQISMGCNRIFNRVLSGGRVNLPGYTGFFLSLFFLKLGPVSAPGRSGPGLTRRAGPGFKIIIPDMKLYIN